jgi:hypothetical protein
MPFYLVCALTAMHFRREMSAVGRIIFGTALLRRESCLSHSADACQMPSRSVQASLESPLPVCISPVKP